MALIKCPECGKEVSEKAGVCPNCGCPLTSGMTENKVVDNREFTKNGKLKKKQSKMSTIAAVLTIFGCTIPIALIVGLIDLGTGTKEEKHSGSVFAIIVFLVAALLYFPKIGKKENTVVDTTNTTTQEQVSDATQEITETSSEEKISKGQSFDNNGLKVTIDDVNNDYTDYDKDWYSPEEGKKYIEVSFTFENTGDGDKYVSIYDFDCYADNTLCEQTYSFGGDFMNTNLSSGRNVSFSTYYVVPTDANNIELEYTSNIWTDEKVVIKVQ